MLRGRQCRPHGSQHLEIDRVAFGAPVEGQLVAHHDPGSDSAHRLGPARVGGDDDAVLERDGVRGPAGHCVLEDGDGLEGRAHVGEGGAERGAVVLGD